MDNCNARLVEYQSDERPLVTLLLEFVNENKVTLQTKRTTSINPS
jgi:hypothetical protein